MPRLTAGIVLIRSDANGDPLFLVLRAYRNWDLPKGRVDPGERDITAARREVFEETGIRDLHFKWGQHHIDTERYSHDKVARFFLAETEQSEVILSREHQHYEWLPYKRARALLVPRLQKVLDWAYVAIQEGSPSK